MEPTAAQVKELRARTGAGVMECRRALAEANGDMARAEAVLRARGVAAAEKKAGRVAQQGLVEAYIHTGGRLGVLVELNCETDFVARTEAFTRLARDLAMQIAASDPGYVTREQIPEADLAAQRAEAGGDEAALEKWIRGAVLLEQPFIRDESRTVRDLVTGVIAAVGENVVVRRFTRYRLGE